MANEKTQSTKSKETVAKKAVSKKTEVKKVVKTEKVEATVATPVKAEKKTGLEIAVFDIKGGKTTMTLPAEVFGVTVNKTLLAQAIRVYLANQRTGNAKALTRGEVTGSTRKIYQQKGTGRARHGGIRAPIFVGGGAAHGPRLHDFSLTMPKKMRKQALFSALTTKKEEGKIVVVKGMETLEAKTKVVVSVLQKIGVNNGKSLMLVVPDTMEKAGNIQKSARNIKGVQIMPVNRLTTYEVLKSQTVLFMQDAIASLTEEGKKK